MKSILNYRKAVLPVMFGVGLLVVGCEKEAPVEKVSGERQSGVPELTHVKQIDVREKGGQALRFEVASNDQNLVDGLDASSLTVALNVSETGGSEVTADVQRGAQSALDLSGRTVLSIRLIGGEDRGAAVENYQVTFSESLQKLVREKKVVTQVDQSYHAELQANGAVAEGKYYGWVRTFYARKFVLRGDGTPHGYCSARVYYSYLSGVWRQALMGTYNFYGTGTFTSCSGNVYLDDFYIFNDGLTSFTVYGSC